MAAMTARARLPNRRDPVSSARRLPSEMHRFHAAVRAGKRNAEGHYALAYGLRPLHPGRVPPLADRNLVRLTLLFDGRAMTAAFIRFPARRASAIFVCEERDGDGWLALAGVHGWLHGSQREAAADAVWLSHNHGVPIRCQYKETQMPFDDTNRGALFRDDRKTKDEDRDYSGSINIDGVEYWLSGRVKTSKKGTKYLSLSVKPKGAPVPDKSKPLADELDDSISF
jgi:hypothetical protein